MKRFKFKKEDKTTLILIAKDQDEAISKFVELVRNVKDWPIMKIHNLKYREKQKYE